MSMGHTIQWDLGGYGGYQAIMWDEKNKVWFGASESRKTDRRRDTKGEGKGMRARNQKPKSWQEKGKHL